MASPLRDAERAGAARTGALDWIGVRARRIAGVGSQAPTRSGPVAAICEVRVGEAGLSGDRYAKAGGKRAVTLVQAEHLPVVASLLGLGEVSPEAVRRNLVVSGVNLQALKRSRFLVGEAVLEGTGDCHPCSKMDDTLGPGGHDAMRGHGGITARVVRGGLIRVGDPVRALVESSI